MPIVGGLISGPIKIIVGIASCVLAERLQDASGGYFESNHDTIYNTPSSVKDTKNEYVKTESGNPTLDDVGEALQDLEDVFQDLATELDEQSEQLERIDAEAEQVTNAAHSSCSTEAQEAQQNKAFGKALIVRGVIEIIPGSFVICIALDTIFSIGRCFSADCS